MRRVFPVTIALFLLTACDIFVAEKGGLEQECLEDGSCKDGLRCDPDRNICIVNACGNEKVNTGEECDPPLSQGTAEDACTAAGFSGGFPICKANCQWSTATCYHEFQLDDPEASLNNLDMVDDGGRVLITGGYAAEVTGNPYFLFQITSGLATDPTLGGKFLDLAAEDTGDLATDLSYTLFFKPAEGEAHRLASSLAYWEEPTWDTYTEVWQRSLDAADWSRLGESSANEGLFIDYLCWLPGLERLAATRLTGSSLIDLYAEGAWSPLQFGEEVLVSDLAGASIEIDGVNKELLAVARIVQEDDAIRFGLRIRDLSDNSVIEELNQDQSVHQVQWSADGDSLIVSASSDRNESTHTLRVFTPSAFGWESTDLDEMSWPSIEYWENGSILIASSTTEDDLRIYDISRLETQPLLARLKMGTGEGEQVFSNLIATAVGSPWLALASSGSNWIRVIQLQDLIDFLTQTESTLQP